MRLAKEIGCVRVQFCKVVTWMKPLRHAAAPRRASLPGAAAELCDRKGARVVAKAGTATVKDQGAAAVDREAVLSDKILHECKSKGWLSSTSTEYSVSFAELVIE